MKCDRFLTISLLLSLGLAFPPSLPAQNPPATTFQPGPWQPVARVDMSRPVVIKIVNQTDIDLNYDLSANIDSSPLSLSPGTETTLRGFVIPAYILINRANAASDPDSASLIYAVEVNQDNLVTITVTKVPGTTPGYTTFNLNQKGAIYIY
jgi:hypothetical protein